MTTEQLQAKREQIAQEYVQVVNRVFCAEMAIQDKCSYMLQHALRLCGLNDLADNFTV